jgi:hypothetical protein
MNPKGKPCKNCIVSNNWIVVEERTSVDSNLSDEAIEQLEAEAKATLPKESSEELKQRLQALGVNIEQTSEVAPVVFEGKLNNGLSLLFFARMNQWYCAIAPSLDDAATLTNLALYKKGTYGTREFAASWMQEAVALALICEVVEEYKKA